ncbi:KICSTOR complex protein SZT2-like isoform X2 [Anarrhichthys ocellatus]|uniref:KICSTOR complex protein SZT2-like isoform X2 n=1 Tax=Anarrhichthys ocellatus TaxID=433405 RepID=UPI0012ED9735|nr:KICSTOR complex protein SZT2-like isoform X2 [Anarrhichthys ocellatus]XP_031694672.1 KICSTOR complex protein SZT2-like isoform X2 [Anarrhichthys ocellatus]
MHYPLFCSGPEITDELVKVLRKRLDETTLDIITVMLVRNCKLTPADVEFIQPSGSPATEVMTFGLPRYCLPWLPAVAHYLRQNLLIFLHVPKYTDSNTAHHFKHYFHLRSDLADGDIYLYNKPGGQGTGGKGIACIALSCVDVHGRSLQVPVQDCAALQRSENCTTPLHPDHFDELTTVGKVESMDISSEPQLYVRFDIWEQGNVSPLQLSDKLQGALRHALCDVIMELRVLPKSLCVAALCPASKAQRQEAKLLSSGLATPQPEVKEVKDGPRQRSGSRVFKTSPSPINLTQAVGSPPVTGTSTPESTTPTSKSTRRSFWDILVSASRG